jgi:hypothetical protein
VYNPAVRPLVRLVVLIALAAVVTPAAQARPRLLFGVDDDTLKWTQDPAPFLAEASDLGVGAVRVTLPWRGLRATAADDAVMARLAVASSRTRIVLEVGGGIGSTPPRTARQRVAYCSYVGTFLRENPSIRDVVIWTEPNEPLFWPRPDAAAYEALLARCYDVAHAAAPDVNVISSAGPHARVRGAVAPARWYRDLGAAYRASGRRRPLFDTVGHNAYPDSPLEGPWTTHDGPSIDQGDYAKLLATLRKAFGGTAQPLPGRRGVTIWYVEDGYQSTVVGHEDAYLGVENVAQLLDPGFQGLQLASSVWLAYCQPLVGAFFNFQLQDDPSLTGWQSGLLYADGSRKPGYRLVRQILRRAAAGTLEC